MSDLDAFVRATAAFGTEHTASGMDLLRSARSIEVQAGDVLVRQGEPANWLGYLAHGLVRIYCLQDDRDVNLGFELEGGFIGDYAAYMQHGLAQQSQQALEPSRIVRFDRHLLDRLLAEHVSWRDVSGRIAQAVLVSKLAKEIEVRTQTAEQRYAALVASGSPLLKRVPLYHLASYLGITPETLSRIRARRARPPRS